jgi:hypothetical protein
MKVFNPLVLLMVLTLSSASAQEFLIPLQRNPVLHKPGHVSHSVQRIQLFTDTLILPFVDDFSRPGMYPFDSLWLDSGVYINNNYSSRPFTIGIATFDGLDQYGDPYHPSSTQDSIADMLTSRPIQMALTPGDTTVWFTFFYEPEGLGDVPETKDSLVLQFKDSNNVWNTVWQIPGRSDTAWTRVAIQILDAKYFFNGFQFRFYNIATVNGNRDHWNIDYVYLKNNRTANDTISDSALLRPQLSLLSEYTAMPYAHYKALGTPLTAMKTDVLDTITEIKYGPTNQNTGLEISQNGNLLFSVASNVSTSSPTELAPYTLPLNSFSFPIQNTDSADFLVKSFFQESGTGAIKFNDTSYLNQRFYNYYAYDDGSAEWGYALSGSQFVSLALRFDIKMQDTLRGVQIYFNPTGENIANELFQLTVWQFIDENLNQDSILYRMINQKPGSFDGINAFKTYLFDSLLLVGPGTIWVGLIQNDPQALFGYGFDKNTDNSNKLLYRVAGDWINSAIHGTVMIRPLFGKYIPLVGIDEVISPVNFSLYPNPAHESFSIRVENAISKDYHYFVYDLLGNNVAGGELISGEEISTRNFSKGIYFVRLENRRNHSSAVNKLVIH